MKKFGLILFAFLLSATLTIAQSDKRAKAVFTETVHDFGKIRESKGSVSCEFTFKNTGNTPFIIQRVQATCGCTTPNYTKEPILPGKEGKISVTYAAKGRPGAFDKKITVFSNVPDEIYVLTIKGEVLKD